MHVLKRMLKKRIKYTKNVIETKSRVRMNIFVSLVV